MKILAILAHPNRKSFTGALLNEFVISAKSAGHLITVADLYSEGFDPCYNLDDANLYAGKAKATPDVIREQERLTEADAMAYFYPIWWWSMPAILKGWIDRIFTSEFAFRFEGGKTQGLLNHRKVVQFCPAASDQRLYRRYGYQGALQRQTDSGIFGYCGIADVKTYIYPEVDENDQARKKHLAHIKNIAENFDETSALSDDAFC